MKQIWYHLKNPNDADYPTVHQTMTPEEALASNATLIHSGSEMRWVRDGAQYVGVADYKDSYVLCDMTLEAYPMIEDLVADSNGLNADHICKGPEEQEIVLRLADMLGCFIHPDFMKKEEPTEELTEKLRATLKRSYDQGFYDAWVATGNADKQALIQAYRIRKMEDPPWLSEEG